MGRRHFLLSPLISVSYSVCTLSEGIKYLSKPLDSSNFRIKSFLLPFIFSRFTFHGTLREGAADSKDLNQALDKSKDSPATPRHVVFSFIPVGKRQPLALWSPESSGSPNQKLGHKARDSPTVVASLLVNSSGMFHIRKPKFLLLCLVNDIDHFSFYI